MKFWLNSKSGTSSCLMAAARNTLSPANAQHRPERFWSVIAASLMRSLIDESIEVTTVRSSESFSTSVVATALPITRAVLWPRKSWAAVSAHDGSSTRASSRAASRPSTAVVASSSSACDGCPVGWAAVSFGLVVGVFARSVFSLMGPHHVGASRRGIAAASAPAAIAADDSTVAARRTGHRRQRAPVGPHGPAGALGTGACAAGALLLGAPGLATHGQSAEQHLGGQ